MAKTKAKRKPRIKVLEVVPAAPDIVLVKMEVHDPPEPPKEAPPEQPFELTPEAAKKTGWAKWLWDTFGI
jgi:hypothetical protein